MTSDIDVWTDQAQVQSAAVRRRRQLTVWIVGVTVIMLIGVDLVAYRTAGNPSEPVIPSVERFEVPARGHTANHVTYDRVPPAGGPHDPVWLTCGIYPAPVRDENAVHSLEHGAVWITYRPDLPSDQVEVLRWLARGKHHMILSPYPGLPAPVVASAWGRQLRLADASDPRLNQFVDAYRAGPQAPEKGGECTQGTGHPLH